MYLSFSTPIDVPLVFDQGKLLKKGSNTWSILWLSHWHVLICTKQKYIVLKTIGHFCHRSLHKQVICQQFSAFKLLALIWLSVNEDHQPLSTRQSAFIFVVNRPLVSFFYVRCFYIIVCAVCIAHIIFTSIIMFFVLSFRIHVYFFIYLAEYFHRPLNFNQ